MADKEKLPAPNQPQNTSQPAVRQMPAPEVAIGALAKFGGFNALETSIEGAQNLNPDRKARKRIFLTDPQKKGERRELLQRLQSWEKLLRTHPTVADMIDTCQEKADKADELGRSNLQIAVKATRDLEQAYRTVALFFKNAEKDKIKNLSVVNARLVELTDLDNPLFIDRIAGELDANFDRLDLRGNYSLLIIPGYLGSNKVMEKWAKIAHKNRVMLITDFEDLDTNDDVIEMFEAANLTGGDAYRANVLMTCNWLVGREQYADLDEDEPLYVPPSTALAGTIYRTLMSQVAAGKKFGGLSEVDGVRFPLKKSEIGDLEKIGLVPMVKEYGKVMAFSAKTLFNGDNLGLQTYSVVRVFDWIAKVLMDFLNRRAFENFDLDTRNEIRGQIVRFLDNIHGPKKLIENFKIVRFEADPKQKDRIYLDIHITPYFPAKNFLIKLDGTKGTDPDTANWDATYEQQSN